MIKLNAKLHTSGDGYWTRVVKSVKVIGMYINYTNDERDFGELRVVFNQSTWNVSRHGLIYTDKLFLKELRELMSSLGLNGPDVEYSEQGMQGKNFVSCDVGAAFIDSFATVYPAEFVEMVS